MPQASEWHGRQRDRVAEAVAEGRLVLLTHGECLDGHSCAGLMLRAHPSAFWLGLRPPETLAALRWVEEAAARLPRGRRARLAVTDLSLAVDDRAEGLEVLRRLVQRADVAWLDHHEPQWPLELASAVAASGVRLVIDRTGHESAATLLLDALTSGELAELGLAPDADRFTEQDRVHMRSVANRDTWSDPDDRQGILLGLASSRLRKDYVTLVAHGEYRALLLLAEWPFKERRRRLRDAHGRIVQDGDVAAVFGPAPLSDLAHELWARPGAPRMLLNFTDDGLLRIRSRPDTPAEAALAARFGGGGHANAAGAPLLEGRRHRLRLYRLLRARDPAVRRVLKDARLLVDGKAAAGTDRLG